MFIFTAKLTKKKLIGAIVAAGLILVAVIVLLSGAGNRADMETGAMKNLKTNDDIAAYLTSLGWEVDAEPAETQEVLIPAEWDAVMESYNELQKSQGLDLTKLKNKRVTRYTYHVRNHPSGQDNIYICLLIYKNRLAAADIQSYALDGFMEPLLNR